MKCLPDVACSGVSPVFCTQHSAYPDAVGVNIIINIEIKLLRTGHGVQIKSAAMELLLVILGVVIAAAAALYGVRLLDRAWPAITKRRTRPRTGTHEEVKLPGHRKRH